jgi:copper chaperone CopZ
MDGIITFGSTAENKISVTFDDQKTDAEKIVQALVEGGVTVREKAAPVP